MREFKVDQLNVKVCANRAAMGRESAILVSGRINEILGQQEYINIVFAAAPSQNEFLAGLLKTNVNWEKVNAFHMDEYVGLHKDAPQGFGNFLTERLFSKVPFRSVHYLNGSAKDIQAECKRYSGLLEVYPTDIVCMGIGENTHIAFNDPHVADFNDPQLVKVVDLDEECRTQQVNDGCFSSLDEVPTHALTLTVPALIKAEYVFCMVPGDRKAKAVYNTLNGEISETYPSSILRTHSNATLYLDKDSSALLDK